METGYSQPGYDPVSTAGSGAGSGFGGIPYRPEPDAGGGTRFYSFVVPFGDQYTRQDFAWTSLFNPQYDTSRDSSWIPFPNSMPAKRGSCFSGEMRKVVQLLAGQYAEILYDYHWSMTHGIFVNKITGERWVIEISGSGVFAWKLPIWDKSVSNLDEVFGDQENFPYLPRPMPLPRSEYKIVLADDGVIGPAYDGQSLSDEIGWAFSASGHEAQNVVVKGGFGTGGYYDKTFRYKVTISANSDGSPLSAVLSLEDSNWFWSEWLQNHIRVPYMTECGPVQKRLTLITQDTPLPPVNEDYEFPVFVYYVGEDAQVFSYFHGHYRTTVLENNPFPATGNNVIGINLDPGNNGSYWTGGNEERWDIKMNGVSGEHSREKYKRAHLVYITQEEGGSYQDDIAPFPSSPNAILLDLVEVKKTRYDNYAYFEDYLFSFVIPWFEREGFFFYEKKYEWQYADQESLNSCYFGTSSHEPGISAYWAGPSGCAPSGTLACLDAEEFGESCSTPLGDGPQASATYLPFELSVVTYHIEKGSLDYCTQCTDYLGQKLSRTYAHYTVNGYSGIPYVLKSITASPLKETITLESAAINHTSYGAVTNEEVEYDGRIFEGTLFEDNSSCSSAESPWWMGAWFDAFQTGKGWVTKNPLSEIEEPGSKKIIGSLREWTDDAESLPASNWVSGWFGCPFPEDVIYTGWGGP